MKRPYVIIVSPEGRQLEIELSYGEFEEVTKFVSNLVVVNDSLEIAQNGNSATKQEVTQ